jgi:hypothetical protein
MIHGGSASGGSTMLTGMTQEDWAAVLRVFAASCSRRSAKGRNDRRFLEALHYFTVHNISVGKAGSFKRPPFLPPRRRGKDPRLGMVLAHDGTIRLDDHSSNSSQEGTQFSGSVQV